MYSTLWNMVYLTSEKNKIFHPSARGSCSEFLKCEKKLFCYNFLPFLDQKYFYQIVKHFPFLFEIISKAIHICPLADIFLAHLLHQNPNWKMKDNQLVCMFNWELAGNPLSPLLTFIRRQNSWIFSKIFSIWRWSLSCSSFTCSYFSFSFWISAWIACISSSLL